MLDVMSSGLMFDNVTLNVNDVAPVFHIVYEYATGWAKCPPEANVVKAELTSYNVVIVTVVGPLETLCYQLPSPWLQLSEEELRRTLEAYKEEHERVVAEALRARNALVDIRAMLKCYTDEVARLSWVEGWARRFSNAETVAVAQAQLEYSTDMKKQLELQNVELYNKYLEANPCSSSKLGHHAKPSVFKIPAILRSLQ